ncbi:hypothetical protein R1sor_012789 [Riccia sorocarpa]|uniref:Protein kinase domain-containing protein n=1 Tax=Riccia sorocarpa TaxID=122646 RepID=A0ABD3I4U8_9MARC
MMNHIIRHAWFLWFAHNVEEKESIRQFYTPGKDKGAIRFIQKLVDLGITTYEKRETNLDEIPITPITKAQEKTMRIWAAKISFRLVEEFKACEPISDNVLRWIRNPQQLTRLTDGKKIGGGRYGNIYKVRITDPGLGNELGMAGIVKYATKVCKSMEINNAWVMMHKELASFDENHCSIVRLVACHNMQDNPILVYPYWNDGDINKWCGYEHMTRGKLKIDRFTKETDVYTLGYITKRVCGDFFTDMTIDEIRV